MAAKRKKENFQIEADEEDEAEPDFATKANDFKLVKEILTLKSTSIHMCFKSLNLTQCQKVNEKVQGEKNAPRNVEAISKIIPEMSKLEDPKKQMFCSQALGTKKSPNRWGRFCCACVFVFCVFFFCHKAV